MIWVIATQFGRVNKDNIYLSSTHLKTDFTHPDYQVPTSPIMSSVPPILPPMRKVTSIPPILPPMKAKPTIVACTPASSPILVPSKAINQNTTTITNIKLTLPSKTNFKLKIEQTLSSYDDDLVSVTCTPECGGNALDDDPITSFSDDEEELPVIKRRYQLQLTKHA